MSNGDNNPKNLTVEEFKQAGKEYTFFQDLALKYLAFYTATLGVITTAFITIITSKFEGIDTKIVNFLKEDFLTLCGLFLIFIGTVSAFVLLKCRDKAITSIKSLVYARKSIIENDSLLKENCYHALAVPRHYKFLSPTQGIIIVIAAINGIAISSIFGNGGIMQFFGIENYKVVWTIVTLTFIQYLLIYHYVIRKDLVDVKLNFKPEQNIKEIKIEYDVSRATTNSSFAHLIARIMFYLIGLTDKKDVHFLRRRRARKLQIENNERRLRLIAGHYKIIAPGMSRKDLLIFGDIYEEFTKVIDFQPANLELYEKIGIPEKDPRSFWFLSKFTPREKKTINTTVRFAFYFFLIWVPAHWELFTKSKLFWLGVSLVFIYFLYSFWKPFYNSHFAHKKIG